MANRYAQMEDEESKNNAPVKGSKKVNKYAQMEQVNAPPKPAAAPAPVAAKPAAPAKAPQHNYTPGEVPAAAISNARQGIADAVNAASDLTYDAIVDPVTTWGRVGRAAAAIPDAVANVAAGAYTNMLDPTTKAQLTAADPRFGKAASTADAVKQHYLNRYGTPQRILNSMAEHPISTAADVATVGTLPGVAQAGRAAAAAVAARVPAGVTRTAQAVRYGVVPTHAINDATNALASRLIPAAARRVENITHPTNHLMMRAAEGRGRQVVNAARTARPQVPGSVPSTVQAVAPARAPGVAALANAAAKARPAAADAGAMVQNNARLEQLRRIGEVPQGIGITPGLPLDQRIQAIFDHRAAQRAADYGVSDGIVAQATPRMMEILDLPLNSGVGERNVLGRARELALQEERAFDMGTPAVPGQWVPDPYGQNLPPIWQPPVPAVLPRWSGRDLDFIKKGFDDLITFDNSGTPGGLGPNQNSALRNSRAQFLTQADTLIPEYGTARRNYGENTRLWNRARIAEYLERKLSNPTLAEDTMTQRADSFATAVNDAARINPSVNKVTGEARRLEEILTPDEMGYVQSILDDLSAAKLGEQQAIKGTPAFGSALDTIASDAIGINPERWWSRPLFHGINDRLSTQVGNALMTPEGAAGLMENALARQATTRRYGMGYDAVRNFLTYGNPARWANRYPALYNALGAQDEQTNAR